MEAGLAGFKELLGEFRHLALWAAGGAAVPFAAHLALLSPPWPQGIVIVTSIFEFMSLLFVYQFIKSARRQLVNRILMAGAAAMLFAGTGYLIADSLFTFQVPHTTERFVKGYICTADAQAVFRDRCPALDINDLATANYEAETLWTPRSIAVVRIGLIALWLTTFVALSVVIGSFIVYQSQVPTPRSRRGSPVGQM